jgi:hypothetical protein
VDSNGTTISATFRITANWTPVDSDDPGHTEITGDGGGTTLFTGTYDSWQTSCLSTSESTYNVAVTYGAFFSQLTVYSTTANISLEGIGTVDTTTVITDTTEVESSWVSLQSSTRSAEYLTTSAGPANTAGFFARTVFAADLCNVLWVAAGPMDSPIAAFCEAFETSDSYVSTGDAFETTQTTGSDTVGGVAFTVYGYDFDTDTDTDTFASETQGPTPLLGTYVIQCPAAIEGYQPYSAMGLGDPIYGAFTIHVASTVTDTSEAVLRAAGATYGRGAITQVVTMNSADTLDMGGAIGGDTTVSQDLPHGGGYGNVPGNNTLRLFPGIYQLTHYDTIGGSTTTRSTVADSTSFTFGRGEVYAISIMDAYTQGAPVPVLLEQTC